jgi:hypothetical protein
MNDQNLRSWTTSDHMAVSLAVITVIIILAITLMFVPKPVFSKKTVIERKPIELPSASKVGEKVGQTSGNFVQGVLKGMYKSTKDRK